MRKIFASVLILTTFLLTIPVFSANGNGTLENPYIITSGSELKEFADMVNNGNTGICAMLLNNISIEAYIWEPIGNSQENTYTGTFDGNGKAISGYSCHLSKESYTYSALFGYNSGTIKNIILEGSGSGYFAAGICANNQGTISGCINNADISAPSGAAGICYSTYRNGIIENCTNNGKITASLKVNGESGGKIIYTHGNAAGIVSENSKSVQNCINNGEVTANYVNNENEGMGQRGSLAGISCGSGGVTGCKNYGKIHGCTSIGGIATGGNISKCINYGDVTVDGTAQSAGGIASQCTKVTDCINYGSVTNLSTDRWTDTGGICGNYEGGGDNDWSTMIGCVNFGTVTGNLRVGGLVGSANAYSEFHGCYYLDSCLVLPDEADRSADFCLTGTEFARSKSVLESAETAYNMNTGAGYREHSKIWAKGPEIATDSNKAVYRGVISGKQNTTLYSMPDGTFDLNTAYVYGKDNENIIWNDTVITEDMVLISKNYWITDLKFINKNGENYIDSGKMTAVANIITGDTEKEISLFAAEYDDKMLIEANRTKKTIKSRTPVEITSEVNLEGKEIMGMGGATYLPVTNIKAFITDNNLTAEETSISMEGYDL